MSKRKTVFFNGKLVGEFESTGDFAQEVDLAEAVLTAAGIQRHEATPTERMFQQATAFAATSAKLHRDGLEGAPRNPIYVSPFVVNAAFAAELYLKTLGAQHGAALKGHNLLKLFDKLPPHALSRVDTAIGIVDRNPGISDRAAMRSAIVSFASAFVDWRYIYERANSNQIKVPEMIFVVRVLHQACRPERKSSTGNEGTVELAPIRSRPPS